MEKKKNDSIRSYLVDGAKFCGYMELPNLPHISIVPDSLTEFRRLKNPDAPNQFIHFYMPDIKFECVYRNPQKYLPLFKRFNGIIGFDFSIHAEFPLYKQIENIAKNRELSFWFSKQGINVIPNVRWGLKETYDWCFAGLPVKSTVAVSTLGCSKEKQDIKLFTNGFYEMLKRLEPTTIVIYGTKSDRMFPPLFVNNSRPVFFESHFTIKHKERRAA